MTVEEIKRITIKEKVQLKEKVIKLETFLRVKPEEDFKNLTAMQVSLLYIQLSAMKTYLEVLNERCKW